MSINTMSPKPAAVAVDGKEPFTPEQIVEQLRMLRQHIPDFGPLTVPDARSLRKTAHVDARFMQAAINTIGAERAVSDAIGRSADVVAAEREDVGRWSAVEDELRAMLQGVAAATLTRRHRLGLIALQTYGITRQLVRNPEYSALLPHVDGMRRMNKFRRRREQPAVATAPAAQK
ncbi:MAG TPA: hypothetical protein VEO54_28335 [Thermoanaerobaculia bacterium]|nr:hypothetical protein [Thermoanaerobaculia bacterium]